MNMKDMPKPWECVGMTQQDYYHLPFSQKMKILKSFWKTEEPKPVKEPEKDWMLKTWIEHNAESIRLKELGYDL